MALKGYVWITVVEVYMWSSLFYIQIFLSEYFSKKPSTIREQVSDCFVIK